jgi:hypothetical protein
MSSMSTSEKNDPQSYTQRPYFWSHKAQPDPGVSSQFAVLLKLLCVESAGHGLREGILFGPHWRDDMRWRRVDEFQPCVAERLVYDSEGWVFGAVVW